MQPLYHSTTERQLAAIGTSSGSYLFVGPPGSGRRLAATRLAQRLNCSQGTIDDCPSCRSIAAGSFADLHVAEATTILGIEQIQQLQQPLSQRPFSAATTRVVMVELDQGITIEAQNRLLKTLEEPPAQTIIVLISRQPESLLPTVRSRAQVVNFVPLASSVIQDYLVSAVGSDQAARVLRFQPTSIGEAITLHTDGQQRQAYEDSYSLAQRFLAASSFGRLVIAQGVRLKPGAQGLITMIARQISGRSDQVGGYLALERAQAELAANVGPRAVLEALALAL